MVVYVEEIRHLVPQVLCSQIITINLQDVHIHCEEYYSHVTL